MKNLLYLLPVFFVAALIFNVFIYDSSFDLLHSENRLAVTGVGASVCGILLSIIVIYIAKSRKSFGR